MALDKKSLKLVSIVILRLVGAEYVSLLMLGPISEFNGNGTAGDRFICNRKDMLPSIVHTDLHARFPSPLRDS